MLKRILGWSVLGISLVLMVLTIALLYWSRPLFSGDLGMILDENGRQVEWVKDDGPAAKGGIQVGDALVAIRRAESEKSVSSDQPRVDGKPATVAVLDQLVEGEPVIITVQRDGEDERKARVVVGPGKLRWLGLLGFPIMTALTILLTVCLMLTAILDNDNQS